MNISSRINSFLSNSHNFSYLLLIIYLTIISFLMFKDKVVLGFDTIFIALFVVTLIMGRSRIFLKDWTPFILMFFFAYEAMRGIADNLNQSVHVWEMINADKFLFGQLPTTFLQTSLWDSNFLHWYDLLGFFFYFSHFWFIFLVGFIIWVKKREYFTAFSWSFIILCILGFITFLLFSAMAPWDASEHQYIEEIDRLLFSIGKEVNLGGAITYLYKWIGPNQVAAMPSLHTAWAWFASLFLVFTFGKKLLLIFIMPLGLMFSLVYFGEHYVVDLMAGILYASFAFWIGKKFLKKD